MAIRRKDHHELEQGWDNKVILIPPSTKSPLPRENITPASDYLGGAQCYYLPDMKSVFAFHEDSMRGIQAPKPHYHGPPSSSAFSSISTTLGFKHHERTNQEKELEVIKCVLLRESVIMKLENLCNKISRCDILVQFPENLESELLNALSLVRSITTNYIECLSLWRETDEEYDPLNLRTFLWEGSNYTLKMIRDLDFLANQSLLVSSLNLTPDKMRSNPLMLPNSLEEADTWIKPKQRATFDAGGASEGTFFEERLRVRNAERILLMELELNSNENSIPEWDTELYDASKASNGQKDELSPSRRMKKSGSGKDRNNDGRNKERAAGKASSSFCPTSSTSSSANDLRRQMKMSERREWERERIRGSSISSTSTSTSTSGSYPGCITRTTLSAQKIGNTSVRLSSSNSNSNSSSSRRMERVMRSVGTDAGTDAGTGEGEGEGEGEAVYSAVKEKKSVRKIRVPDNSPPSSPCKYEISAVRDPPFNHSVGGTSPLCGSQSGDGENGGGRVRGIGGQGRSKGGVSSIGNLEDGGGSSDGEGIGNILQGYSTRNNRSTEYSSSLFHPMSPSSSSFAQGINAITVDDIERIQALDFLPPRLALAAAVVVVLTARNDETKKISHDSSLSAFKELAKDPEYLSALLNSMSPTLINRNKIKAITPYLPPLSRNDSFSGSCLTLKDMDVGNRLCRRLVQLINAVPKQFTKKMKLKSKIPTRISGNTSNFKFLTQNKLKNMSQLPRLFPSSKPKLSTRSQNFKKDVKAISAELNADIVSKKGVHDSQDEGESRSENEISHEDVGDGDYLTGVDCDVLQEGNLGSNSGSECGEIMSDKKKKKSASYPTRLRTALGPDQFQNKSPSKNNATASSVRTKLSSPSKRKLKRDKRGSGAVAEKRVIEGENEREGGERGEEEEREGEEADISLYTSTDEQPIHSLSKQGRNCDSTHHVEDDDHNEDDEYGNDENEDDGYGYGDEFDDDGGSEHQQQSENITTIDTDLRHILTTQPTFCLSPDLSQHPPLTNSPKEHSRPLSPTQPVTTSSPVSPICIDLLPTFCLSPLCPSSPSARTSDVSEGSSILSSTSSSKATIATSPLPLCTTRPTLSSRSTIPPYPIPSPTLTTTPSLTTVSTESTHSPVKCTNRLTSPTTPGATASTSFPSSSFSTPSHASTTASSTPSDEIIEVAHHNIVPIGRRGSSAKKRPKSATSLTQSAQRNCSASTVRTSGNGKGIILGSNGSTERRRKSHEKIKAKMNGFELRSQDVEYCSDSVCTASSDGDSDTASEISVSARRLSASENESGSGLQCGESVEEKKTSKLLVDEWLVGEGEVRGTTGGGGGGGGGGEVAPNAALSALPVNSARDVAHIDESITQCSGVAMISSSLEMQSKMINHVQESAEIDTPATNLGKKAKTVDAEEKYDTSLMCSASGETGYHIGGESEGREEENSCLSGREDLVRDSNMIISKPAEESVNIES